MRCIRDKGGQPLGISIRKEIPADYPLVREVMKSAFPFRVELNHTFNEWVVVENTRDSEYYINDLSLVAVLDGVVVGHILFTPMTVQGEGGCYQSLALAPVSVHSVHQNKGIGKRLIQGE